jgi:hypothetical protein
MARIQEAVTRLDREVEISCDPLRREQTLKVVMAYLETEAMNHPYREAEAVLLADPSNLAF